MATSPGPWNSIYPVHIIGRKKRRQKARNNRQRHPSRLYCRACGRRVGSLQAPKLCPIHGEGQGVSRRSFQGYAGGRTRARRRQRPKRFASYEEYLASSGWATRRAKVVARDRGLCQDCGSPGRDVHHIHYRSLRQERGDELILLCRSCHEREHMKFTLSDREDFWRAKIDARLRTRGAVCLEGVGAGPSSTPAAQVEASGNQGNPGSALCMSSHPASMLSSRGERTLPEKTMLHQARSGDGPGLGDADQSQRLDAACRQSRSDVTRCRSSRSGTAMDTRTS